MTGPKPYRNGVVGNHEAKLKPGVESLIPRLIKQGYDIVWRGKVGHFNQRAPYYIPEVTVLISGRGLPGAVRRFTAGPLRRRVQPARVRGHRAC